jgi:VanZ family protein
MCAVLWLLAFAATHTPLPDTGEFRVGDKTLHLVGYAGLTFSLMLAMGASGVKRRRRILTAALALPAYGLFDESTQPLVGRHASGWDWLVDLAGIAIAVVAFELLAALVARRPPADSS